MNVEFPRLNLAGGRCLAVYKFPGEKVCARIAVRDMALERLPAQAAGMPERYFEAEDRDTGRRELIPEGFAVRLLRHYYDAVGALLNMLDSGEIREVKTPRYTYRAAPGGRAA